LFAVAACVSLSLGMSMAHVSSVARLGEGEGEEEEEAYSSFASPGLPPLPSPPSPTTHDGGRDGGRDILNSEEDSGYVCEGGDREGSARKMLKGPVFVVGCGHSGTTMLHRLLSQVPGILGVGNTLTCGVCVETGIFVHAEHEDVCNARPGCPASIGCSAEAAARVALNVADDGVESIPAFAGVYCDEVKGQGKVDPETAMRGWDRLTCSSPGHRRWLEKTPKHVYAMGQIWASKPGARIVHVVRDGRDVALSIQRRMVAIDRPRGDKDSDEGFLRRAAKRWVQDNWAALAYESDPRIHVLRLEDISSDPAPEVRRLLTFLGEPSEPADVERVVSRMNSRDHKGPEGDSFHVVPPSAPRSLQGLDIGNLRKQQISAGLGGLTHVPVTLTDEQAAAMASVDGFVDLLVRFGYAPSAEAWH